MAEPLVVKQVREFQAALLKAETAQFAEMGQVWLAMEQKLEAQFMALALEIEQLRLNGKTPTAGQARKLERLQSLFGQAREETNRYAQYASDLIEKRKMEIASASWQEMLKELETSVGKNSPQIAGMFDRLPKKAFENMAGLMADGSPVRVYLNGVYGDAVTGMVTALEQAVLQGWNPVKTARAMRDGLALGLNRALTVARTEQLRAMREATRMGYAASGMVPYYKRIASKSDRTCIACLLEDGKKYPVTVPFEEHPQGRCSMVACVTGEPDPDWETGEVWFLKQAEETQREILGPGLFGKWKAGGQPLSALAKYHEDDVWGGYWRPVGAGSLKKPGIVSMRRVPNGNDISILDIVSIDENKIKERVVSALKIIEEVHGVDVIGKVNIKFAELLDGMGNFDPGTMTITIDPRYDSVELTTIHEIAHYVDYAVFGKGKNFASSYFSGTSELSDWREELFATKFYKNIREEQSKNRNDDYLRWVSKPYEMFSIFYTKMIAKNMIDPTILINQLTENEKGLGIDGWKENEIENLVSSISTKLKKKGLMKDG